jgi:hypothetical protein
MEGNGQLHALAALHQRKLLSVPTGKETCGPHSRSGQCEEEKNIVPARNRTPAIQPITHSYTNWAIQTPLQQKETVNMDSCFDSNHTKPRYKFCKAENFLLYMWVIY